MAKIKMDPDLRKKGYIGYFPADIESAASMRKPGYLDYVNEVALKNVDGLWYLDRESRYYISNNFFMDKGDIPVVQTYDISKPPDVVPSEDPKLAVTRVYNWRILNFYDNSNPCQFEGCIALRKAYEEDEKKLTENCTACEKNKVRKKYEDIIKQITENEYGKF